MTVALESKQSFDKMRSQAELLTEEIPWESPRRRDADRARDRRDQITGGMLAGAFGGAGSRDGAKEEGGRGLQAASNVCSFRRRIDSMANAPADITIERIAALLDGDLARLLD